MRKIYLECGDGLYRVLNDRENLEYPLILIFNNEEFTVNNTEELEDQIERFEEFCKNEGQKLIDNTKTDLFN